MKVLYVIDPTARQYGYSIKDGLKVKLGSETHTIVGSVEDIEKFHSAIENGDTFTVYDERNLSTFNGGKIIGAKIVEE
jgi:hypothetical protein